MLKSNDIIKAVKKLKTAIYNANYLHDQHKSQRRQTLFEKEKIIKNVYDNTVARANEKRDNTLREVADSYIEAKKDFQEIFDYLLNHDSSVKDNLCERLLWDNPIWESFEARSHEEFTIPPFTRVGDLIFKHDTSITIPALPPIIGYKSMLIKANSAGKEIATNALQAVVLRLLATMPAGKLKVILLDPRGLGKNMGGLVNLPETIHGGQVWQEGKHIEEQLQNLVEHINTVNTKYIRNEYETIEAYNADANLIEEAYRLVVVNDFPYRFSDDAAQRLIDIALNGQRTGVYIIATVDIDAKLPYNFNLAELERLTTVLQLESGNNFLWQDKGQLYQDYALILDEPPNKQLFNDLIQRVGERGRDADRIVVPFSKIIPLETEWWSQKSDKFLSAAIGQQGANKIQYFEVGKGTAHHGVIAGQTGSGKSVLLHAIITSLCLNYSPYELELYLLDFKEVEFSIYATYDLPHVKIIATKAEREFGFSTLEKLNGILKERQAKCTDVGCQNLVDYRSKTGEALARIVLMIDEFQALFSQEDSIKQNSLIILSELVRLGRSFGIHIILASQSLKGSGQLPGEILDQMAIRIALMCTDADSRIILGDDNPAARLLSRPGEAYYNNRTGEIAANERFQVVMLTRNNQKTILEKLKEKAEKIGYTNQPVIFNGDQPAEIIRNYEFIEVLNSKSWPELPSKGIAWLGEPVRISVAVKVFFLKERGMNLMVLGQNSHNASTVLAHAWLSLAIQFPSETAFYVIDLTGEDSAFDFRQLDDILPHESIFATRTKEISAMVEKIANIVDERQNMDSVSSEKNTYFFVLGLHKARDLRKSDNFGSFGDELPTPDKLFTKILQKATEVKVHTLVWCNNNSSLQNTLDFKTIDEFDSRVALQMSEDDSNSFVNSRLANQLSIHQALFYQKTEGSVEKFRPYSLPSPEWLAFVKEKA